MTDAVVHIEKSDCHHRYDQYVAVFVEMTSKQREVFTCLADNRTSKEIAASLQVSEAAVVQRIEAVRSRTGFPPRAELARAYRRYLESGFFDLEGTAGGDRSEPVAFPSSWQKHAADWVLPGAMVGANAGLNRIAAMVVIAGGMLLVALASLGIAKALTDVG